MKLSPTSASQSLAVNMITLSPSARLDHLIQTISTILRSYRAQPTASPIHITALQRFLKRASDLHPSSTPSVTLTLTDPELVSSLGGDRSSEQYNNPDGSGGAEGGRRKSPTVSDVETLEKDWWESEVFAAWYGPRPRPRPKPGSGLGARTSSGHNTPIIKGESIRSPPVSRGNATLSTPKIKTYSRETSRKATEGNGGVPTTDHIVRVGDGGLHSTHTNTNTNTTSDELIASRGEQSDSKQAIVGSEDSVGITRHKSVSVVYEEIMEKEQRLRRDISYVGLNDDCL
ncbi:hypothetical protein IAR55_002317 [Kwoniella newhampshirensis]|uniref:Uncharacterized protein n=1 Tax=Kwoniella newhampshirensis TaxID=1651941 RepID=A0AAW0YYZ3_9TREE